MILFAHIIGQQFGMGFLGCEDKINSHVSMDSNFSFFCMLSWVIQAN